MSVEVYTDGSFRKKGNNVYCGYGVYFPDKNIYSKKIGRKFTHSPITGNRAELYAILKTLNICNIICKKKNIKHLKIYSDSEYSVKTINKWYKEWLKNGKDYKNKDIIDDIMLLIKEVSFNVEIIHVRSHIGIEGNEIADKLAKKGANRE